VLLMRTRTILTISFLIVSSATVVARSDKHKKRPADQQSERTTAADPKVALSVCLRSGSITVHGWDRNQVRARTSDGTRIDFQRSGGPNAEPAKELSLVKDDGSSRTGRACLPFGDIQLDVPREASVSLQAGDADIKVSGVAKVHINTQNGSIAVEQVSRAADINTLGGDISIRNSQGPIKLHSVGGSIEAHDIRSAETVDVCEAGSVGGDIALVHVNHAQLKVNAVNGAISFSGPLAAAGHYSFQTIAGDINLSLPADSSFRLSATISRGEEISSDFPLKSSAATTEENEILKSHTHLQRIEASYGTGDASITLSSFSGSVQLRKK
jgi:hypothetical protein